MSKDIRNEAINIISNHRTGVLSSVENNRPHSRYMTFYNDELTLYSPTQINTEKVDEIENNAHVSVLLGYEEKGQSDEYVEIAGTCKLVNTPQIKEKIWNDSFTQWFDGPDDANYGIIEIHPETIRILNIEDGQAREFSI